MFRGTSSGVERTQIFTKGLTHLTVFECLLLRFHLDVSKMFFKIIRENIEMNRISQIVLMCILVYRDVKIVFCKTGHAKLPIIFCSQCITLRHSYSVTNGGNFCTSFHTASPMFVKDT